MNPEIAIPTYGFIKFIFVIQILALIAKYIWDDYITWGQTWIPSMFLFSVTFIIPFLQAFWLGVAHKGFSAAVETLIQCHFMSLLLVILPFLQLVMFFLKVTFLPDLSWWIVFSPMLFTILFFLIGTKFVNWMDETNPYKIK